MSEERYEVKEYNSHDEGGCEVPRTLVSSDDELGKELVRQGVKVCAIELAVTS